MKKVEEVFNQLSKLYEFNKKLQTFKIKHHEMIKGQQIGQTNGRKPGNSGNPRH
jgi:hypothetical protein